MFVIFSFYSKEIVHNAHANFITLRIGEEDFRADFSRCPEMKCVGYAGEGGTSLSESLAPADTAGKDGMSRRVGNVDGRLAVQVQLSRPGQLRAKQGFLPKVELEVSNKHPERIQYQSKLLKITSHYHYTFSVS